MMSESIVPLLSSTHGEAVLQCSFTGRTLAELGRGHSVQCLLKLSHALSEYVAQQLQWMSIYRLMLWNIRRGRDTLVQLASLAI